MPKELKVVQRALSSVGARNQGHMTGAELKLAAERMTSEIEARAKRRERGALTAEDEIMEITEWV